jgi:hypothetical protein
MKIGRLATQQVTGSSGINKGSPFISFMAKISSQYMSIPISQMIIVLMSDT